ncbi:hypothetical protein Q8A67_014992 [Cirrhinus molitorella]|uniref:Uncharacterized protein n=1 Tax=Cirrhinus molitorella TaxID=172907 RepID=A0AA88TN47_9TELE|nr:hypothetical protein Q8A67_014992 [Cirrhinus molitorella]
MLEVPERELFRRTPRETPNGIKSTVRRPGKKNTAGRKKRRGETVSTSLARQGGKQRERCASEQPANPEQIRLCPPIRLPTSAPLPRERERRRERSQQHEKGKESKAATFATTLRLALWLGLLLLGPASTGTGSRRELAASKAPADCLGGRRAYRERERERKGDRLVPMRRVLVRTVGQGKGGSRGGTCANGSCSGSSDREHEPE